MHSILPRAAEAAMQGEHPQHIEQIAVLKEMGLKGSSLALQNLRSDVIAYSNAKAPILITGDTGTGKSLVARAIHYLGNQRNSPFVSVNCATIPEALFEREFFGVERGAYSLNTQSQPGLVELANSGTLFLDGINHIRSACQASLLRFLESNSYRACGALKEKKVNVKIIATSNQDLNQLVQKGEFRKDLLYRVDVIRINVPSLRDRQQDITLVARNCILELNDLYQMSKTLSTEAEAWLCSEAWPGNIRDLKNSLHRLYLVTSGDTLYPPDANNNAVTPGKTKFQSFQTAKAHVINNFERQYLCSVLLASNGNVTTAAKIAGKERRSFTRLIQKHRLDRNEFSAQSPIR